MLLFLFPLGWGEAKTKWLWESGVKDCRAATSLGPLNNEESQPLEHFPPGICCFVQSPSCVWLFAIPWTATHQASLSFTISQSLLKFMSFESVVPSNQLILCCPLLLLSSVFPSTGVFYNELTFRIRWPKYWSFGMSPSNEYSGLISFRDWLVWSPCSPRDFQEFSSTPQFKSISSLVLSLLYGPILITVHD